MSASPTESIPFLRGKKEGQDARRHAGSDNAAQMDNQLKEEFISSYAKVGKESRDRNDVCLHPR